VVSLVHPLVLPQQIWGSGKPGEGGAGTCRAPCFLELSFASCWAERCPPKPSHALLSLSPSRWHGGGRAACPGKHGCLCRGTWWSPEAMRAPAAPQTLLLGCCVRGPAHLRMRMGSSRGGGMPGDAWITLVVDVRSCFPSSRVSLQAGHGCDHPAHPLPVSHTRQC